MMAERLQGYRMDVNNPNTKGFVPGVVRELLDHISQLEAQRGGSMDLTEDALSLACGCELPPVEGVDAIKFGLRSSLRSGYRNGWRDACAKMQRGGAVVVPAWNRSDFDKVPPEWSEMQCFGAGYELAASRIQPIPAGGALADGMVGVDRERLAALEAISDKIEALALGPDGRAWTPLHYREFARGELRRAQQAKGE